MGRKMEGAADSADDLPALAAAWHEGALAQNELARFADLVAAEWSGERDFGALGGSALDALQLPEPASGAALAQLLGEARGAFREWRSASRDEPLREDGTGLLHVGERRGLRPS